MTLQLIDAGERYINQLLNRIVDFDEYGNAVRFLDRLKSRRLIEELLNYRRGGNYDLISALIMAVFAAENDLLTKREQKEQHPVIRGIINQLNTAKAW